MKKRQHCWGWLKGSFGSCLSWALTGAWLTFIYFKIRNGELPKNLNEFGDFLAGAFAPLAFFWLVRGFYQQGKGLEQNSEALRMQATELKKTTKALELQVEEMRASVSQQAKLAQVYEDELQQKHFQAQPYFKCIFKRSQDYMSDEPIYDQYDNLIDTYKEKVLGFRLTVHNLGEVARNLVIQSINEQPSLRTYRKSNYLF
ncbi:MAG TPA: hypothetical protein PLH20_15905 [Flavobacterium sp.]|nr:hypothetical protein [Flavobacterium sp.]